jgi:hypothetical protein
MPDPRVLNYSIALDSPISRMREEGLTSRIWFRAQSLTSKTTRPYIIAVE